jgi:hypothetical protein
MQEARSLIALNIVLIYRTRTVQMQQCAKWSSPPRAINTASESFQQHRSSINIVSQTEGEN